MLTTLYVIDFDDVTVSFKIECRRIKRCRVFNILGTISSRLCDTQERSVFSSGVWVEVGRCARASAKIDIFVQWFEDE